MNIKDQLAHKEAQKLANLGHEVDKNRCLRRIKGDGSPVSPVEVAYWQEFFSLGSQDAEFVAR